MKAFFYGVRVALGELWLRTQCIRNGHDFTDWEENRWLGNKRRRCRHCWIIEER